MHALDQWCTNSAHRCPDTLMTRTYSTVDRGELGIGAGTCGLGLRVQNKVEGEMCVTVKGKWLQYSITISDYRTNNFQSLQRFSHHQRPSSRHCMFVTVWLNAGVEITPKFLVVVGRTA